MIQIFLIVIILVILISTLNIKESFYFDKCPNIDLNAINNYHDNKPCIELFFDKINNINKAFIVIKNKHSTNDKAPLILNISKDGIITASSPRQTTIASPTASPTTSGRPTTVAPIAASNNCVYNDIRDNNKHIIKLTEDIPYLQLGNTYLITLNIKSDNNYTASDTLEITFKDVKLAENNLNKTNSNILNILKNKKINLII